jgi:HemX protein
MSGSFLWLAFVAYFVASTGFMSYLLLRRPLVARLSLATVAAGFLLHTASYGMDCVATRAMVVTSMHGSFSLLAFLTVLVFLAISARHHLYILGAFVMPLVLLGTAVAAVSPLPGPPAAVLQGPLFPLHVILNFTAFAGFVAAFGVAIAFLIQERQLKSGKPQTIAYVLPPLNILDRLNFRLLSLSVMLLAAGMVTGMLYVHRTKGAYWPEDPKVYATVTSFVVYLTAIFLRLFRGWRGRRTAFLLIAGFILVLVTFIGMGHLLPQHLLGL